MGPYVDEYIDKSIDNHIQNKIEKDDNEIGNENYLRHLYVFVMALKRLK